jgi:hypothetical protein
LPPVVTAVANETTQSPFDATDTVTPVESSTVDAHPEVPTEAAFAGAMSVPTPTATNVAITRTSDVKRRDKRSFV